MELKVNWVESSVNILSGSTLGGEFNVFEPLNNVLAPLELTDITAGLNIKIFLEKLGISKVTGYGQLWKRR